MFQKSPMVRDKKWRFAIASETDIPIPLVIVSYIFFLPAAAAFAGVTIGFAFIPFALYREIVAILTFSITLAAIGMIYMLTSRGLRKLSLGWRKCALTLIGIHVIFLTISLSRFLSNYDTLQHRTIVLLSLRYAIQYLVLMYAFYVLNRSDIRRLFHRS